MIGQFLLYKKILEAESEALKAGMALVTNGTKVSKKKVLQAARVGTRLIKKRGIKAVGEMAQGVAMHPKIHPVLTTAQKVLNPGNPAEGSMPFPWHKWFL